MQFQTPGAGMAAAAGLALQKFDAGKNTINALIAGQGGWTPGYYPAANNIARTMGIKPDAKINLRDPTQLQNFLQALVTQEHGPSAKYYPASLYQYAANQVLGTNAPSVTGLAPIPNPAALSAAVPTAVAPTLRRGMTDRMTGGAVSALQQRLQQAGYNLGRFGPLRSGVDGVYGPVTAAAVKKFQTDQGLSQRDAVAGPQTQAALSNLPYPPASIQSVTPPAVSPMDYGFGNLPSPMFPAGVSAAVPGAPPAAPGPSPAAGAQAASGLQGYTPPAPPAGGLAGVPAAGAQAASGSADLAPPGILQQTRNALGNAIAGAVLGPDPYARAAPAPGGPTVSIDQVQAAQGAPPPPPAQGSGDSYPPNPTAGMDSGYGAGLNLAGQGPPPGGPPSPGGGFPFQPGGQMLQPSLPGPMAGVNSGYGAGLNLAGQPPPGGPPSPDFATAFAPGPSLNVPSNAGPASPMYPGFVPPSAAQPDFAGAFAPPPTGNAGINALNARLAAGPMPTQPNDWQRFKQALGEEVAPFGQAIGNVFGPGGPVFGASQWVRQQLGMDPTPAQQSGALYAGPYLQNYQENPAGPSGNNIWSPADVYSHTVNDYNNYMAADSSAAKDPQKRQDIFNKLYDYNQNIPFWQSISNINMDPSKLPPPSVNVEDRRGITVPAAGAPGGPGFFGRIGNQISSLFQTQPTMGDISRLTTNWAAPGSSITDNLVNSIYGGSTYGGGGGVSQVSPSQPNVTPSWGMGSGGGGWGSLGSAPGGPGGFGGGGFADPSAMAAAYGVFSQDPRQQQQQGYGYGGGYY
jgi:peptidoglycan hydrolase-like protein with peptidoglycan-binding domain